MNELLLFIVTLVPLLISVSFLTLLERKAMASFQTRRGPNFVGFLGLLQPLADGLKLFLKETVIPYKSSLVLYMTAPLISFSISLLLWFIVPNCFSLNILHCNISLLLVFGFSSLNVYSIIISGWSSNSNYALLGSLRSAAQMISYEISLTLILLPIITFSHSLNLLDIMLSQQHLWFIILFFPHAVLFFISILAETNRTPFDLPEAEAELVSGYNVEYSSLFFALFFLAEYSNIILMSALFVVCFLGGPFLFGFSLSFIFILKQLFIIFLFIWVRCTYPRYRFDQLMFLGWKTLLPFSLCYIFLITVII
jgi:NADH:ubiquinone oxidoreductase subunit H